MIAMMIRLQNDPARKAEDLAESSVDLEGAKPQRDGDAEQGRYDGYDVYGLPDGAVDAVADKGAEDGADLQVRHVPAVAEVCNGEADDGVDHPRVQPLVEERGLQSQ
jgi:hypothetical protein